MGATEKKEIQEAIGNGTWHGRYTPEEILDYCESDVAALARLLPGMLPKIDLPRALLRGRYMWAAAAMEFEGIPIDVETLAALREGWDGLKDDLIGEVDRDYGVYDGRRFSEERFAKFLARNNIPWPLLESGRLCLDDDDAWRPQAKAYPVISPLRELRHALSDLKLNDLAVGSDGHNRCMLSAFRARPSRNAPSSSRYIFGPSVWIRGLIKPPPGYVFFYPDWRAMEFGIAAALSGDPQMQAAYLSGDPYLAFAKQAGAAPADATKETHGNIRELFKTCGLGVQYGMGEKSLALRIGGSPALARDLLRAHHEAYPIFWRWSDAVVDTAMLTGSLHTVFGWVIHIGEKPNVRSLRNYLMQGNGAEIMRVAACLMVERGIPVGGPVHDAFAVCSPVDRLGADMAAVDAAMREASRIVLSGFELDVEIGRRNVIHWPSRYMDKRGRVMWDKVMMLLDRQRRRRQVA
jgi:hypothetical protein